MKERNGFDYDLLSDIRNVPVAGALMGKLKSLPDDWPIVSQLIETENISRMALGLGTVLNMREIAVIMNLLEKYKLLWIDHEFIKKLIINISGRTGEINEW